MFAKAPLLASFFRYVCDRYLNGECACVKEYSIAVEALGRSPDFDPRKDSIVRVEAHHLRKRLQRYYVGEGKSHSVHIVLPPGQYVPEFISHQEHAMGMPDENSAPECVRNLVAPDTNDPAALPHVKLFWQRDRWAAVTGLLVLAIVMGLSARSFAKRTKPVSHPTAERWLGPATAPVPLEYRMLAGYHGSPVTDADGNTWNPDAFYTGGSSNPIAPGKYIEGEPGNQFIRSQRAGFFSYDIPVRQGTYELHLYFAETEYGGGNPRGPGRRPFNISINGIQKIQELDPLAEAGAPNVLHCRIWKNISPAADGKLHLKFDGWAEPFVNALEILPSAPGHIRPIRIVMQPSPVTDTDGHVWSADEFFSGGYSVMRQHRIADLLGKPLFQGERYGKFAYHIPLAPGKYSLTLYFAETWWGTPESHASLEGERVFDVFANGAAILKSFEIAKESHAPYCGIQKVFTSLEPNAQGILDLQFVPLKNNAEVNAIEVVETD
jgi:hypothetical protein